MNNRQKAKRFKKLYESTLPRAKEAEDPRPWWAYSKPKITWPHTSLDMPKFSVGNDSEGLL